MVIVSETEHIGYLATPEGEYKKSVIVEGIDKVLPLLNNVNNHNNPIFASKSSNVRKFLCILLTFHNSA